MGKRQKEDVSQGNIFEPLSSEKEEEKDDKYLNNVLWVSWRNVVLTSQCSLVALV